jgi:transposase
MYEPALQSTIRSGGSSLIIAAGFVRYWNKQRTKSPCKYQSGEINRTGGISRCGDEMMRAILYEAAQILLVRSIQWSWLKAWAMQVARRRGMKKAIVALAQRLAVIMHRIWIDSTEFSWIRPEAAAA